MRDLREHDGHRHVMAEIEQTGEIGGARSGIFTFDSQMDGRTLRVIASADEGWDHVSISRVDRCPSWPEMEQVKRLFFRDDETAMQLHLPPSAHISVHPYCLHLWRPWATAIPLPPRIFV